VAISSAGGATGTNSATLPSFNSGDIALVLAFRDGSTTNPTVPAGWNNLTNTSDGTTCSMSVGWRRLTPTDTTTGTWTNATRVQCVVYRGCEPFITPTGGTLFTGAGTTNTVTYGTVTMTRGDGTSWVVGLVGHRSVDTTIDSAAITGMTARSSGVDANAETAAWDTNGGVSSWSSTNQTITGTASGWQVAMIELLAFPAQADVENAICQPVSAPMRMG
jgi:hypothetical protein